MALPELGPLELGPDGSAPRGRGQPPRPFQGGSSPFGRSGIGIGIGIGTAYLLPRRGGRRGGSRVTPEEEDEEAEEDRGKVEDVGLCGRRAAPHIDFPVKKDAQRSKGAQPWEGGVGSSGCKNSDFFR